MATATLNTAPDAGIMPAAPANVQDANLALVAGSKWASQDSAGGKTVITYSFAAPGVSTFSDSYGPLGFTRTAHEFSDADKGVTRDVLSKIAAVCNVEFVEVADNASGAGVIRYAYSDQPNNMGFSGYAFYPSESALGGDVWIGSRQAAAEWDGYRPDLILHETLHALGLKHPFEGGETLSTQDNIIPNTVMSYSPIAGAVNGTLSRYPGEPMSLDIAALQALYGAATHNEADTTYNLAADEFQGGFRALWDSAGTDTLDASAVANAVQLDLNLGASSDVGMAVFAFAYSGGRASGSTVYSSTLTIAQGTVIENATGSGFNDTIRGNSANNLLRGGGGDDRLEGGGGNDVLDGGSGLDKAVYALDRQSLRVSHVGDHYVVSDATGRSGTDVLASVERIACNNANIALDLDGNAGVAALLLGAVAGVAAVHNKDDMGRMLALLDGGASAVDAAGALCAALVGQPLTSQDFVQIVYRNLTGHAASQPELGYYTSLLDQGIYTQATLALAAANMDINIRNVDLVGLSNTGLEYNPVTA